MNQKLKSHLFSILKIAFALSLFYWVLSRGTLSIDSFKSIMSVKLVAVTFTVLILMVMVNNWRWWFLLKGRHFEVTFFNTLNLSFIGLFFNFAMPGSVGGDVIKAFYVCKDHPDRKIDATFTILMDRIVGVYAMLTLAIVGVLISWKAVATNLVIINLFWLMCAIAIGVLTVFVFFLLQNDQAKWILKISNMNFMGVQFLVKILKGFQAYRNHIDSLFVAYLLSFVSQLLAISLFVFIGFLLGENLAFEVYLFAVALGFITSSIPISPGGVGVGQVAFYFFFKTYTGQDLQVGTIGITVLQAAMFLLGLVGGLLYLKKGKSQSGVEQLI